jgi:sugar phosphate isomerase/epimerase
MKLALEAGAPTMELAAKNRVRGVPISAQDLAAKGVEATLAPLRERGLEAAQIGAFGWNPLHPDPAVLATQTQIVTKAIELAPGTGCRVVVLSCGNHQASAFGAADRRNRSPEAIARYAAALRPLLERAEHAGVLLSIEAYIKGVVWSPEAYLQLEARAGSKALRCNLDVSSLYDLADLIDPAPRCREICSKLAGHVGLVHIKDAGLAEGFHIHAGLVPITSGPTDWKAVLAEVKRAAPSDGWLLLEHVQSAEEAASSLAHLRKLAAEVGLELD